MIIAIYCEPLRTATSGTPMRAMIKELIQHRLNDHFKLIVREGYRNDKIIAAFFKDLVYLSNWEIVVERFSRKLSNVLGLLKYGNYCAVSCKADIYLNPDCNSLGPKSHPLIVTIHDLSAFKALAFTSYKSNWQLWLRRFMLRDGARKADAIVAISNFTKKEIIERFKGSAENTTVIYNGINDAWFEEEVVSATLIDPYWVWWGFLSSRKNIAGVLKAYGLCHKRGYLLPKFKIIYGNVDIPAELLEIVKREDLGENIIWQKRLPFKSLKTTVVNSRGLLFPSFVEGFGMPVLESFACGVPVLTSNTTSLNEIAGNLAVLVDPNCIESIAAGMVRLNDVQPNIELEIMVRRQWAAEFTALKAALKYSALIDNCNL